MKFCTMRKQATMNNYVVDTLYSVARYNLKVKAKSMKYSNKNRKGIHNLIQTKRIISWQQGDIGLLMELCLLKSNTYTRLHVKIQKFDTVEK